MCEFQLADRNFLIVLKKYLFRIDFRYCDKCDIQTIRLSVKNSYQHYFAHHHWRRFYLESPLYHLFLNKHLCITECVPGKASGLLAVVAIASFLNVFAYCSVTFLCTLYQNYPTIVFEYSDVVLLCLEVSDSKEKKNALNKFVPSSRKNVIRPENSGNWTLQIKYPQPRDSGIYECQINTEPKMSLSYTFNVIGE
uniref:Ig-like domain-containing protein n=1 Tax=Glossina brevipalpis TaxID=37001 RepID=A0A1A9WMR6_9MUSC